MFDVNKKDCVNIAVFLNILHLWCHVELFNIIILRHTRAAFVTLIIMVHVP